MHKIKFSNYFFFLLEAFLFFSVTKGWAQSVYTEQSIVEQLRGGYGGIVVKINHYKPNKGIDFDKLSSENMVLKNLTSNMDLYYLVGENKNQEIVFKKHSVSSFFILIQKPGAVTITRFTAFVPKNGFTSMRIFKNVTVEAGKLKYVGDINYFERPLMVPDYRPDEFLKQLQQEYPATVPFFTQENVLVGS